MAKNPEEMTDDELDIALMSNEDLDAALVKGMGSEEQYLDQAYIPQEEKPLIDVPYLRDISTPSQWYGGIEKAAGAIGALSTPLQYASAPFVQAARATSQMLQGQPTDEFINPITNPLDYARKYGSSQALMETLPTGNKPISEMIPETSAGNYLSKEFPRAMGVAKSVSPNNIASIASDIMVGSKVAPSAASFVGEQTNKLMRFSESKIPSVLNKEMLADQILSGHSTDLAKLNELKNSGKFDEVRDFFLAHPELNRVKSAKALDEISGDVTKYFDEYGRPKSGRFNGLISRLNEQQSEFIGDIPVNKRTTVSSNAIQEKALEALDEMNLTQRARRSAEKFIREEVPVFENPELNKHPVDYADTLRKTSNKLMGDSAFTGDAIERSAQESAAMALEKASRSELDRAINLMPDTESEAYRFRQQDLSNAMRLKDLYSKARVDKSGAKVPVGDMGRGVTREILTLKPKYIDPFLLDAAQRREAGTTMLGSTLKTAQQSPSIPAAISAIPTELQAKAMQRGLVENLADYEIPRNSQEILANPQMALAKLSQITDNPQMVRGLQDAIEKHPDKLKSILPLMGLQFPNLFVADKYNRFDGKIFDPNPEMRAQLIQRAYKDVELKKDLSNTEKAMLWDGLNRDGSLPDTFQ